MFSSNQTLATAALEQHPLVVILDHFMASSLMFWLWWPSNLLEAHSMMEKGWTNFQRGLYWKKKYINDYLRSEVVADELWMNRFETSWQECREVLGVMLLLERRGMHRFYGSCNAPVVSLVRASTGRTLHPQECAGFTQRPIYSREAASHIFRHANNHDFSVIITNLNPNYGTAERAENFTIFLENNDFLQ